VELSSIRKKWKNIKFAAGVDRVHVETVTADFSRECFGGKLDLWTHIGNVLAAMQEKAEVLMLNGRVMG
jgi:predicted hydrolase (HD superfamily)